MKLAFEHLNLRRNPFGEFSVADRCSVMQPVCDLKKMANKLKQRRYAVQFIGHQGRGKSTHLHALHQLCDGVPFTYIAEGESPNIPPAPIVFVDESQRLSPHKRKEMFRRQSSFAIATHEDHQLEFDRYQIVSETHHIGGIDNNRLIQILNERIESSRRGPGPLPTISRTSTHTLITRYDDNLRDMFEYLYDVFQNLEGVCDVQV